MNVTCVVHLRIVCTWTNIKTKYPWESKSLHRKFRNVVPGEGREQVNKPLGPRTSTDMYTEMEMGTG